MGILSPVFGFFISLCILVITGYLLIVGEDLLIPLVIAIAIWYLIISVSDTIGRLSLRGKKAPYWLTMLLSFVIWVALIYLVSQMITANITSLIASAQEYQDKFTKLVYNTFVAFGIKNPPKIQDAFQDFDLVTLATQIAQTLTYIAGSTGVILIYVLFLLLEYQSFDAKLSAIVKDDKQLAKTRELILKISSQTQAYMKIKTFISIMTALISYIIIRWVGLDFAEFWALLIFLLNFIPNIGSITATLFPCLLALVQFDTWTPFLILALGLTSIQFIIGNIVEPRVIGRSSNLSGLVIILSLALWGKIWGIVGMFLCVPIMVIINIILANFPQTRFIPILLSRDGKIT